MNATQMLELRNRVPFQPFEIHLNNSMSMKVDYPYLIATQPNAAACAVYGDDGVMRIVAYRNIAEVITSEPHSVQPA